LSYRPNEKTLELNVISNILESIRSHHPNAYAYGVTMNYEGRNGLDSGLDLTPNASLVAFQFKRVHSVDGNNYWFEFNNNTHNNQHNLITRVAMAVSPPSSIFYALPAFATTFELERDSPNFLLNTFFINPLDIGLINDHQPHYFELDVNTGNFQVHSKDLAHGKAIRWEELHNNIKKEKIITVKKFKSRLEEKKLDFINEEDLPNQLTRLMLKALVLP